MTRWFVTRHPGASDWVARHRIEADRFVVHLEPETIQPGDIVMGVLPVNLVAEVELRGGRFFNLSIDLPPYARGQELTADELDAYGARLEEYRVERLA